MSSIQWGSRTLIVALLTVVLSPSLFAQCLPLSTEVTSNCGTGRMDITMTVEQDHTDITITVSDGGVPVHVKNVPGPFFPGDVIQQNLFLPSGEYDVNVMATCPTGETSTVEFLGYGHCNMCEAPTVEVFSNCMTERIDIAITIVENQDEITITVSDDTGAVVHFKSVPGPFFPGDSLVQNLFLPPGVYDVQLTALCPNGVLADITVEDHDHCNTCTEPTVAVQSDCDTGRADIVIEVQDSYDDVTIVITDSATGMEVHNKNVPGPFLPGEVIAQNVILPPADYDFSVIALCSNGVSGQTDILGHEHCSGLPPLDVDIEICGGPGPFFGDTGADPMSVDSFQEVITVADVATVDNTRVLVNISTAFVGDIVMGVTSPDTTQVTLHEGGGGADDDLHVRYDDLGIANAAPYNCECEMQPSGPGVLGDFTGGPSMGDWLLDVEDTFPTSRRGTLNEWCLLLDVTGAPMPQMFRGDCDGDGVFNGVIDGLQALNFQFVPGTPAPPCLAQCDADSDRTFNGVLDGIYILNFQFVPGAPPIGPPFPCGTEPMGVDSIGQLGCDTQTCP